MLEALLAGIILIVFLAGLKTYYFSATPQEEASMEAFMILKELDGSGLLRNHAIANDYQGLNSEIMLYNYNHSVEICNSQGTCFGEKPFSDNIWVGSYFISGSTGFSPRTVNLYLWRDA
jgi:hypothetical protein